jgi:hypothetical protein
MIVILTDRAGYPVGEPSSMIVPWVIGSSSQVIGPFAHRVIGVSDRAIRISIDIVRHRAISPIRYPDNPYSDDPMT